MKTNRVIERDDFRLEMYATNRSDWRGSVYVGYRLYDGGELIFAGEDYSPGPCVPDEFGDQSAAGLLAFLSCRPGDTDPEYFDGYTPEQLEWAESRGEELSLVKCELEERR